VDFGSMLDDSQEVGGRKIKDINLVSTYSGPENTFLKKLFFHLGWSLLRVTVSALSREYVIRKMRNKCRHVAVGAFQGG
jgi:hypothetical protein